jgi:phosphonatase-like hydrolase
MLPELIVFDLAGTTVNDNQDVHKALQASLNLRGISISLQEANEVMGIPKPIAIKKLLEDKHHPSISDKLIDEIHTDFENRMVEFYLQDGRVSEKKNVSHTFSVLRKKGIKVAVDTGFNRKITDALLSRLNWIKEGLIDTSVTSDEVENGRPYPDLIFEAMKRTGVSRASRVAKVGDTASDMQEGTRAGCHWVIGITWGAFSKEELSKEPHTHLAGTMEEVVSIVMK